MKLFFFFDLCFYSTSLLWLQKVKLGVKYKAQIVQTEIQHESASKETLGKSLNVVPGWVEMNNTHVRLPAITQKSFTRDICLHG